MANNVLFPPAFFSAGTHPFQSVWIHPCINLMYSDMSMKTYCATYYSILINSMKYSQNLPYRNLLLREGTFSPRHSPIEVLLIFYIKLHILSRDLNTHPYTKNINAWMLKTHASKETEKYEMPTYLVLGVCSLWPYSVTLVAEIQAWLWFLPRHSTW